MKKLAEFMHSLSPVGAFFFTIIIAAFGAYQFQSFYYAARRDPHPTRPRWRGLIILWVINSLLVGGGFIYRFFLQGSR